MKNKLSNEDKINLVLSDLESWLDGGDDFGSMRYAFENGYKLHAASLWLSTGALSEDISKDVEGITIDYTKEKNEIDQLCKEAYIYICKDCNAHMFLSTDEGDDIQCGSCLKIATINKES